MHVHSFDSYIERTSPIHQLDPRTKVISAVALILSSVLFPDGAWVGFLLTWLLLAALAKAARIGIRFLLYRSLIAIPFALAAVTVLFTIPGRTIAVWTAGPFAATISDAGLLRFVSILVRSWLAVQSAVLLTAVTRFPDIVHALRHLRVPAVITAILSFMYRYLFVLADEALRLRRARAARSARLLDEKPGGSVLWRARVAGRMVGQLFLRSYERSDRVYNAMLARGYRGELLTIHPHHMIPADWIALTVIGSLLLTIQLAGRLAP